MTSKTRTKTTTKAKKNLGERIKDKITGGNKKVKTTGISKSSDTTKGNKDNTLGIEFNNIKFEIVGEDKIDSLSAVIEEAREDKIVTVIPEYIFRDLGNVAQKYLKTVGVDILSYLNSDLVRNLLAPYRGIRGNVSGRDFMIWKENNMIIITIETNK